MKSLLATALVGGLLLCASARATTFGVSGFVTFAHANNGCAAILLTPEYGNPSGGVWFAIDLMNDGVTPPQAATAEMTLVLGASQAENFSVLFGVTPTKLGLDYDPTQTVVCGIDGEGDGQITAYRATHFNYPPGAAQ